MNNLYKKLYNAINEAVLHSLILPDEIEQDVSIKWHHSDIASHAERERKIMGQTVKWQEMDLPTALAYEMHVNDIKAFPNIAKRYKLCYIGDQQRFSKNSVYDELPFLKIMLNGLSELSEVTADIVDAGFTTYDQEMQHDEQTAYKYMNNMNMIKNIYTAEFMKNDFSGFFMSLNDNILFILYRRNKIQYAFDVIPAYMISDDLAEYANMDMQKIKKDPLTKTLSKMKLLAPVNKCGFIPAYDDNGKLYYETFIVAEHKKQIDNYRLFYNELLKNGNVQINNGNITGKGDAEFFCDLDNGHKLCITQFEEKIDTRRTKYGWRVFIR